MKEIKAIIRPSKLHKVRDAFRLLPGFPGMNICHVEGCSAHSGEEHHDTLKEELTDFSKKLRIEIVAPDELLADIVAIIHRHAHTGKTGDGVLWVTDVVDFRRLCVQPV